MEEVKGAVPEVVCNDLLLVIVVRVGAVVVDIVVERFLSVIDGVVVNDVRSFLRVAVLVDEFIETCAVDRCVEVDNDDVIEIVLNTVRDVVNVVLGGVVELVDVEVVDVDVVLVVVSHPLHVLSH